MSAPRRLGLVLATVGALLASACGGGSGTTGSPTTLTSLFGARSGKLYLSQDNNANGLFLINTTTGAATLVGTGITGVSGTTCGLTETQNPSILLGSLPFGLTRINVDGSGQTPIPGSVTAEGLAMNITTGILYGHLNGAFFTVDPVTGVNTGALAGPGGDIAEGLAADPVTNRVYGLGGGGSNLLVYDVGTNTWSTVGSTGLSLDNIGLAFDHFAGVLYAVSNVDSNLYRINPTTAVATLVGPLGTAGRGGLAFVVD